MTTWHNIVETSLGELTLVRDQDALRGLYFRHHWHLPDPTSFGEPRDEGFADAVDQLQEYLAGERLTFDLPLAPHGNETQRRIWDLIQLVEYGQTTTYGELAREVGVTARHIGSAVGRNPLSIFIPCHRVIGRNGALTGYAGGLARKQQLLDLEQAHLPNVAQAHLPDLEQANQLDPVRSLSTSSAT